MIHSHIVTPKVRFGFDPLLSQVEHGESDAGQIISASGSVPLTKDAEGEVTEILGWFYGDLVGLDGDLVVILWYFTGDFIVFIVIYWDFMMIYWDLMVIDWWFMYSWLDLMWFLWGKMEYHWSTWCHTWVCLKTEDFTPTCGTFLVGGRMMNDQHFDSLFPKKIQPHPDFSNFWIRESEFFSSKKIRHTQILRWEKWNLDRCLR